MRNKLAALLLTTALCAPASAHAAPVFGFVSGVFAALGAYGASGAAVGLAIGGSTAFGVTVGSFFLGSPIARALLSFGISAAVQALQNVPSVPSPSDRLVNFAQDVTPMVFAVGRTRLGGPLGFTGFTKSVLPDMFARDQRKSRRHYAVLLAAHSCKGVVEHWLDEWPVEVNEAGFVTSAPIGIMGRAPIDPEDPLGGIFGPEEIVDSHCRIRFYTGKAGQTSDPILMGAFDEITASHDFAGLTYAALYAVRPDDRKFSEVYPTSRQWAYAPVIDGLDDIYDPRTGLRGWTDNAALVIASQCERFGKVVDWDEVAEEADVADELVTNRSGAQQRRWTINGTFDSTESWETVRARCQVASDAWFYERVDGSVGFRLGHWIEPTVTLTDRDLLSIRDAEGSAGPDTYGEFALSYVEPSYGYTEVASAPIILGGGGRDTQEGYLVNSNNQAARLNYRRGLVTRSRNSISVTTRLRGYELIGQRFVRVQSAVLGVDGVFEIQSLSRSADGASFEFEGTLCAEADFDFDAALQEPAKPARASVASDDVIDPLVGLSGTVVSQRGGAASILYEWPEQDRSLRPEIQFRSVTAGIDWQSAILASGATSFAAVGLVDGETYEAQIRNRTSAGRASDWLPEDPISIVAVANTVPPDSVTDLTAIVSGSDVDVSWVAPNDAVYFATRIFRASDSTDFGDAVLVRTEYGIPSSVDGFTDTAPGVGADHSYWAEAINASGVAGPRVGPITISIP